MKRTPEEHRARRLVSARSGGVCESCGMQRATEFQHRVRRSQGGPWSAANGVHLDHQCHSWVTGNPVHAGRLGLHLRSWQDPATTPVKLFGRGWVLLDLTGGTTACDAPLEESA